MSLYKIPLVFFLTRRFVSVFSSPQPAPAAQERKETIFIDIPSARRWRLPMIQIGQILLGLLEASAIIYHHLDPNAQEIIHRNLYPITFSNIVPPIYTTNLSVFGAILWIIGTQIRISAFSELGRFFRFDVSIQQKHKLITTGPYAYVRHPSYTGLFIANFGWLCYHFSEGSWLRESGLMGSLSGKVLVGIYLGVGLMPTVVVALGRLKNEDEILQRQFGKEWEAWAEQVPSKIIPRIY